MELKTQIANWIKRAREDANMSGTDLALKLTMEMRTDRGYSKATISHWEHGRHSPTFVELLALVRVMGKSLPDEVVRAVQGEEVEATTTLTLVRRQPRLILAWDHEEVLLDVLRQTDERGQREVLELAKNRRLTNPARAVGDEAKE